jgi:leucyl/phenylalanyl-tRNA--protein transferase
MPIYLLHENEYFFPSAEEANEDGLLAIGGDLHPERLLNAYAGGIFPWFSEDDEIMWWSPDPRTIMLLDEFKTSKSLMQSVRNRGYEFKMDTAFREVIESCAEVYRKDEDSTWITKGMIDAYCKMHEFGVAHSAETWYEGELVGGLYGISLGKAFFGESMFFKKRDASKVAYYHLIQHLKELNFDFIDTQMSTSHLISLGAKEIPRKDFLSLLTESLQKDSHFGNWGNLSK